MMQKDKILNLETRSNIYNFIKDNPGLHLHELARKLDINYQNLRYHLNFLKKHDMISLRFSNSYLRAYVSKELSRIEKDLFTTTRQKTQRHILLSFILYVVCSQNDLSKHIDKHPTTIEYHLKKLIEKNLIVQAKTKDGHTKLNYPDVKYSEKIPKVNEKLYTLKDPVLVVMFFWNHKETFKKDKVFKVIFKQYLQIRRRAKQKKHTIIKDQISLWNKSVDNVSNVIFDIFRPPFAY